MEIRPTMEGPARTPTGFFRVVRQDVAARRQKDAPAGLTWDEAKAELKARGYLGWKIVVDKPANRRAGLSENGREKASAEEAVDSDDEA